MRFPTKAKCRAWLATLRPDEVVGERGTPGRCPMANLIRSIIGQRAVRISVVPPVVKLFGLSQEGMVAQAPMPRWACNIIDAVDANLPPHDSMLVTAAEVTALLH